MTVSLSICFFRDIATLLRTLDTVAAQERRPDEVVIADDGSELEFAEQIAAWADGSGQQVLHAWHPKLGFRQSEMRNKAALVASSDYVVFIDHDCLLPRGFIRKHLDTASEDRMQQGPRINVMPPMSESFRPAAFPISKAFLAGRLYEWRSAFRRKVDLERPPKVICGCNLLVPRKIITAVNGFDEEFKSWGYEDADFVVRAWRAGFGISLSGIGTTVFHIHHPSRANDDNLARFNASVAAKRKACEVGISRHAMGATKRVQRGMYTRIEFPD